MGPPHPLRLYFLNRNPFPTSPTRLNPSLAKSTSHSQATKICCIAFNNFHSRKILFWAHPAACGGRSGLPRFPNGQPLHSLTDVRSLQWPASPPLHALAQKTQHSPHFFLKKCLLLSYFSYKITIFQAFVGIKLYPSSKIFRQIHLFRYFCRNKTHPISSYLNKSTAKTIHSIKKLPTKKHFSHFL